MNRERIRKSAISAIKPFYKSLPILLGAVLLISLASALIPKSAYAGIFSKNILIDPIIGAGLGSILAGNPITSYVLGGEFINLGISLIAVTAFLISWVTVGIVQLPAEMLMLGKRFAITRNILSFTFSIIIAVIVTGLLGIIS